MNVCPCFFGGIEKADPLTSSRRLGAGSGGVFHSAIGKRCRASLASGWGPPTWSRDTTLHTNLTNVSFQQENIAVCTPLAPHHLLSSRLRPKLRRAGPQPPDPACGRAVVSVSPQGLGPPLGGSPCATSRHILQVCYSARQRAGRDDEVRSLHPDCRDCRGDPQRHRAAAPSSHPLLSLHPIRCLWSLGFALVIRCGGQSSQISRPSSFLWPAAESSSMRSVDGCVRSHHLDHAWTPPLSGDRARFQSLRISRGFTARSYKHTTSAELWIQPTGT